MRPRVFVKACFWNFSQKKATWIFVVGLFFRGFENFADVHSVNAALAISVFQEKLKFLASERK